MTVFSYFPIALRMLFYYIYSLHMGTQISIFDAHN